MKWSSPNIGAIHPSYQRAINKMGRAIAGTFQSTPLGIVMAESKLAPAGPLLDFRQVSFTKRLLARPKGHHTSHLGIEGNEIADDWAKGAAEDLGRSIPRAYLCETNFAHMTRRVTEARAAGVSKWTVDHVNRRRRYSPPKGQKLRKELRHERKALAGRYY